MSGMDLGAVINLIMENPELLAKIKGLVDENESKGATEPQEPVAAPEKEAPPEVKEDTPVGSTAEVTRRVGRMTGKRSELLHALSPYISEGRQKALESFMTIADILELMREK